MLSHDYQSTMDLRGLINEDETRKQKPHLPVLIIPGFMSSGLEIQESSLKKSWEGKRLWINLGSLGFQALHIGGAVKQSKDGDDGLSEHKQYKSLWIQHMTLLDDMQTEYPGVRVRNIDGLSGVDYLSPGALTSLVSYVFGPVIAALMKAGYQDRKNLDAAPYDWRLPPSTMERRDQYFSLTMQQIERLYRASGNRPIVLLCHSLGCKVGHYLLNFAKLKAGQTWIDKHIHTYMPVGGPHLGAPKALRSAISGDKMGLEAFLKDEEALAFGRSLGSGPWLIPTSLPDGATTSVIVRKQGSLSIDVVGSVSVASLIEGRVVHQRPDKVKLLIKFGNKTLASRFVTLDSSYRASFDEKFIFATESNRAVYKGSNSLLVFLCEPGISSSNVDKNDRKRRSIGIECWLCCLKVLVCYCLWCCCFKLVWCLGVRLAKGTLKTADALAKASGGSSVLGLSKHIQLTARSSVVDVQLCHRKDVDRMRGGRFTTFKLKISWEPWREESKDDNGRITASHICKNCSDAPMVSVSNDGNYGYVDLPGDDLIRREQLSRISDAITTFYDGDELGPRSLSATDTPPVQRVKAIYGINLPTEVGAIYKRHRGIVESDSTIKNYYTLDKSAKVDSSINGHVCEGGVLFETKETVNKMMSAGKVISKKVSGDGTVPFWSLQHCQTWDSDSCHVTVQEIDGANHREILADERFHEVLLDYVTVKTGNDENV